MIRASMLKLEPSEITIDPAIAGVAHLVKKTGDNEHQAWVQASQVRSDPEPHIHCFPHRRSEFDEAGEETRKVRINEWTT